MKRYVFLLPFLCFYAIGCCSGKLCTQTINFYRDADVNGGRPCAVDIIYPKDKAELDKVIEIGPQKWFTSDLYDHVHKDKAWLETDVKLETLANKSKDDAFIVIFAEFTAANPNPPRGQEAYILYTEQTRPKAHKVEYIGVHNGALQRLDSKPSR